MKQFLYLILFCGFSFGFLDSAAVLGQVPGSGPIVNKPFSVYDIERGPPPPASMRMPPCTPVATNNNIASSTVLVMNAAAIVGTTCSGTLEASEAVGCNTGADQSVWYNFTATATTTYVTITLTSSGCYLGSAVWPGVALPTNICTMINCQAAANGPVTTIYKMTTIVGQKYSVQVTYTSGGPCGNNADFTIAVGTSVPAGTITNPPPPTNCPAATSGCYFTSPPTTGTVTSTCTGYPLITQTNLVNSGLYSFTTAPINATQLSIQDILQSTCPSGNVAWGTYKIYDVSCNLLACGNIAGGNLVNVACNTTYYIQYMWEELSCSSYTTQWPYQYIPSGTVGCGTLPIELLKFDAISVKRGVQLNWVTLSEINNDYFTLEKSIDGEHYDRIARVKGAGNSTSVLSYDYLDEFTMSGTWYYRLRQTDYNGHEEVFTPVRINLNDKENWLRCYPNPAWKNITVMFPSEYEGEPLLQLFNIDGKVIFSSQINSKPGLNRYDLDIQNLLPGIYYARLSDAEFSVHTTVVVSPK